MKFKISVNSTQSETHILIAGCGTGRYVYQQLVDICSKVMAIDLSRASIAFMIRQTESYGLKT